MRAAANRKVKAKREADGHVRLERRVLSDIVLELRGIIAAVIAGEKVVLHVPGPVSQREGQYAPDKNAPDLRDGSSEGHQVGAVIYGGLTMAVLAQALMGLPLVPLG
jgi:hypothetical protein